MISLFIEYLKLMFSLRIFSNTIDATVCCLDSVDKQFLKIAGNCDTLLDKTEKRVKRALRGVK